MKKLTLFASIACASIFFLSSSRVLLAESGVLFLENITEERTGATNFINGKIVNKGKEIADGISICVMYATQHNNLLYHRKFSLASLNPGETRDFHFTIPNDEKNLLETHRVPYFLHVGVESLQEGTTSQEWDAYYHGYARQYFPQTTIEAAKRLNR